MAEENLVKNEPNKVYALFIYYDLNYHRDEHRLILNLSYYNHDLIGIFDSEEQAQVACRVYKDSNEYRHYMKTNYDNPCFVVHEIQLNHAMFPELSMSRSDVKCIAVEDEPFSFYSQILHIL